MNENERFPHMYAAERDIWKDFLRDHRTKYIRFEYDVHVGRLWPELEGLTPPWRVGAEAVYKKRIDVIGFRRDQVVIFEVKAHAGLGALGQIVGYVDMYEEEFAPAQELIGAVVTRLVDPNLERIFRDHGVELYKYPEVTHVPA